MRSPKTLATTERKQPKSASSQASSVAYGPPGILAGSSRFQPCFHEMPWNLPPSPGILSPRRRANLRQALVRCVFLSDSGSLTLDIPPSETSRWRAVARVLRSPMDALGCALLPASCALCGSPLPRLSSVPICDACWMEFPVLSGPLCARCGDTLATPALNSASGLCRPCRLAPPPFERAVAFGPYEDRMKAAIHALKYDRLHAAARGLGPDAGRSYRPTGRRGALRDAGGPGSAASVEVRPARLQPGAAAGRYMR